MILLFVSFNSYFPQPQKEGDYSGFDLTTHRLHFMSLVEVFTNHILAGSTYFVNHIEQTEHKIMI